MRDRFHPHRRCCAGTAIAVIAALLSGCEVGPDFLRPEAPPSAGYTPEPLKTTAATDIPGGQAQRFVDGVDISGQWWMLFHSRPLNAVIDQALAHNPTLESAQANLRQAKEQLYAGEGAFFPTVTGDVSTTREKFSTASVGFPGQTSLFTLNDASVNVSYVLDIWGGTRRQVESLAAQAEFERFELEASYLALTANVVTAAVTEASLRAQIAVTQEIITIESQELDGLRRQFSVGAAADTAVLAQAAALAQARAQLPPLQKQLDQTRDQLIAFLGRFPNEELGATFDLDALRLPDTLPVSLPSKLVEQRPDIRAAEAELHEATAQVGVATANMLPQLTLSGSYGTETTNALFTPGSGVWSLGAGVAQTIFDGGKLLHQRRAAVAALDSASAQYRNVVVTAFQNVADSLRALQSDAAAVDAQAAAERAAADSLAASRRQFNAGAITYLSLLNAEQTYEQGRIALVQAVAARFSDTAALFQALGGGWWNRTDVAAKD
jgi:NodT family efflux transporter outer membrane factor (OMF) lipoprotein